MYPRNGIWSVAINNGDQKEMIQSLKKLMDLKVSYIVPSLFIGKNSIGFFSNRDSYETHLLACIERLEGGATH